MSNEYRVNLDIYNGPLDLLLYLIRRDEVDIHDIPIARITEQYVQYGEMIQSLGPNLAGEFLVLAATLMEIKTRMLLPTSEAVEEGEEGGGLDPRAELVRQLLEYKAFKDAAEDLRAAGEEQALKYPRGRSAELSEAPEMDMEDVQVWDLLDAFNGLMAAIGADLKQHEVIYDDTPLELHATDIMDRLEKEGPLTFAKVFEGRASRLEIVGLFLALLELVRQKRVLARQEGNFGEVHIAVNPNPPAATIQVPADEDRQLPIADRQLPIEQQDAGETPAIRAAGEGEAVDEPVSDEGQYISEDTPGDADDESGREDPAAWP